MYITVTKYISYDWIFLVTEIYTPTQKYIQSSDKYIPVMKYIYSKALNKFSMSLKYNFVGVEKNIFQLRTKIYQLGYCRGSWWSRLMGSLPFMSSMSGSSQGIGSLHPLIYAAWTLFSTWRWDIFLLF